MEIDFEARLQAKQQAHQNIINRAAAIDAKCEALQQQRAEILTEALRVEGDIRTLVELEGESKRPEGDTEPPGPIEGAVPAECQHVQPNEE